MVRTEFVIVGCILVLVGLGLCVFGYQKTQPTLADTAVSLLEQISNQKAPQDIKPDKSQGYIVMGIGVISFLAGIGMLVNSRTGPR